MNAITITAGGVAVFIAALGLVLWSKAGAAVFLEHAVSGFINCF